MQYKHIIKGALLSTVFSIVCTNSVQANEMGKATQVDVKQIQNFKDIPNSRPMNEIGAIMFEDTNGNGIQDKDEDGIPGLTVELLDHDNHEVMCGPDGDLGTEDDAKGRLVTDSKGEFHFYHIPLDTYRVVVVSQ